MVFGKCDNSLDTHLGKHTNLIFKIINFNIVHLGIVGNETVDQLAQSATTNNRICLLYTSDAADE